MYLRPARRAAFPSRRQDDDQEGQPKTIVLVTDLEALHPYLRPRKNVAAKVPLLSDRRVRFCQSFVWLANDNVMGFESKRIPVGDYTPSKNALSYAEFQCLNRYQSPQRRQLGRTKARARHVTPALLWAYSVPFRAGAGIFFTGKCYRIPVNSGFGGVPIGAGGDPTMMFNFVDLPEC
jgi:hypothetical protein